jgi:hypothetical protein
MKSQRCYHVGPIRSPNLGAKLFQHVQTAPGRMNRITVTALNSMRQWTVWDERRQVQTTELSALAPLIRSISLPWSSPSSPAKIPKAQPNLR